MSTNLYSRFISLLPQRPLLIGTVESADNGVAQVTMPGGGTMAARGSATVGTKVFVRDGAIEGNAPDLPVEVIEV